MCETAEEEFQWLSRCSGQAGEGGETQTELRPCVSSSPHTPLRTSICPITHEIMEEPVICADGHSYERKAIAEWLSQNKTSPLTGAKLPHMELVPNHALRNLIEEFSMQQQVRTCILVLHNGESYPSHTLEASQGTTDYSSRVLSAHRSPIQTCGCGAAVLVGEL